MLFFCPLFITMQEKSSTRCLNEKIYLNQGYLCCSQFILKRGLRLTLLTFSRDRQCILIQYDALLSLERDRRLSIVAQYLIVCCPHKIPSQILTNSCHGNKYCGIIGTM